MSASGDGKQIDGISKDSESKITSKTDNGGDKTVTELKDKMKQKVTDANRTEAEFDKKDVTLGSEVDSLVFKNYDSNVPLSAAEKSKQETDITNRTSEDQENEDITQEGDMINIEPKEYFPKEIADIIQADADKDSSSLGEDLELRWDEDDDESETTSEVLKMLTNDSNDVSECNEDKKSIEKSDLTKDSDINVVLKSDELKSIDSSKTMPENTDIDKRPDVPISSVNDSLDKDNNDIDSISSKDDKTHDNDDVEMANTSLESEKILDQIDSLTKESVDVDMEKFDQSTTEITDKNPIPDVNMEEETKIETENAEIVSSTSNIIVDLTNDHKKQHNLTEKESIIDKTFEKVTQDIVKNINDIDMQDLGSDKVTDVEMEPANIDKDIDNTDNNQVNTVVLTSLTIENVITEKFKPEIKDQTKTDSVVCEQPKMNEDVDITFDEYLDETSQTDDSMLNTITPNVHHRINKPNVMLDIPTQELSDIEAELDDDFDEAIEDEDKNQDIVKDTLVEELSKVDAQIDVTTESVKEEASSKEKQEIDESNIDMKESKESVAKAPIALKDSSPTIEIDGTTSKLNITSISPKKTNETSKLIHESTVSKSLQFNELKSSTSEPEKDDSKSPIKLVVDIDESNSGPVTEEISTNAQDTDINKESKQNAEDITSIKTEFDGLETTLKIERIDEKPSTSNLEKFSLTPDPDSVQEVTDSLGLLAESSRVMDDDEDDADDPEADDNDDDEDFDPYDETNSEMAEDMEDSNTPPPELDSKKPGVQRESDEGTQDAAETTMMDIDDDIECVENELPEMELAEDVASETPSIDGKDEPVIIADTDKDAAKCPSEKIINIVEKVLKSGLTGAKSKDSTVMDSVRSYVELEGSSDSDDVQEVSKPVTSVKIPLGVEVMTSGPHTSEILSQEGGQIISGLPTPSPHKMSKINTSEVTIKTAGTSGPALHIPETTSTPAHLHKDEIYNLIDSDDEDNEMMDSIKKDAEEDPPKPDRKCINPECTGESRTYYRADRTTAAYYSLTGRSAAVCEECKLRASKRSEALIKGIKELHPLLELEMDAPSQQLVEISDSESEGEGGDDTEPLGETNACFLEEHLADMINETWVKYKMESRLHDTRTYLMSELEKIEADAKEIDAMLDECQKNTDAIRHDFYKDYESRRKPMGAIVIYDTPFSSYSHTEKDLEEQVSMGNRYPKRRAASLAETPAKRPSLLGNVDDKAYETGEHSRPDDDKEDISVVKLSAEAAPADLPPCGEITRPPIKVGMNVYAMKNVYGTWHKAKIMDIQQKGAVAASPFTHCRVRFEHKAKASYKVLAARFIAYPEPTNVRLTIGTRVVALFKDPHHKRKKDPFYSGVVAEIPNPVNSYRYLVFFDDGYAQYVSHQNTRIVCESSTLVWDEVHPFIRDFICDYLLSYPERPMVRLRAGERLKTEWNGRWWDSKVLKVDASIALIHFYEDNRTEWIYRGSTRLAPLYLELQAAEKAGEGRTRSRLPKSKATVRSNMPCVEYTRSDEQANNKPTAETRAQQQHNEELCRQRSVAKKSTSASTQPLTAGRGSPSEEVVSRVVYYTPKNAVRPLKMVAHTCTVQCRRSDLLTLKDLRTYNPLAKPLLSGWERLTVRYKGHRAVMYRAPCGRRLRNMQELHSYLRIIQSDMCVDLFDFTPGMHCLAEFVLYQSRVSKKDLSHGKENVPVPCVNYFDDTLPEFCSYNTERTPTSGVPLNLDPEFLCGCDCTDDCMDKTKCACWKMTLEGARTIGLEGPNVGYVYRRLPEPLPSGIYECNSRCKCKHTCLNRVAQHPLQSKLQVFKTVNRGWGIRTLNDVPKGSFLCVYAGNLLTDATANLDGLNEGDEYLAELDYIEVVEAMKEGYEDDVPEADKKLDKKSTDSEPEPSSSSEEEKEEAADGDFQPGYIPHPTVLFKKSLRKREKAKKKEEQEQNEEVKSNDCITISDDEEVREPSRFTAQAGIDKDLISKQSSRVSVRTLFGKDEACYIMDAKVQGNIGRYLNHSCHPNVFVQNVFVDTHDPRFPWVAFFALSHVRAGTELTWNYNYDIGSVPEKVLYCYCGAPNCRGRLL